MERYQKHVSRLMKIDQFLLSLNYRIVITVIIIKKNILIDLRKIINTICDILNRNINYKIINNFFLN